MHCIGGGVGDGCVVWCMCGLCGAGNGIGPEGAVAMGPHLGKLVNMRTLDLAGTRSDALHWGWCW